MTDVAIIFTTLKMLSYTLAIMCVAILGYMSVAWAFNRTRPDPAIAIPAAVGVVFGSLSYLLRT